MSSGGQNRMSLDSDQTLYPWHLTPDAFERRLKDEHDKYGKLIRMIGVRVD